MTPPKNNLFLVVPFLLVLFACHEMPGKKKLAVAFYNCENFFDTIPNPAKYDTEFTPQGKYHYTRQIYEQKLHNIATVLQSMDDGRGPAIAGLAEVENNTVLNQLISQPEIKKHNYKYVWIEGPDPRGINVALIYDPGLFRVIYSEPIHIDLNGQKGKTITRDILHVCGILLSDTLSVFVNHWPSRMGGESESNPKRVIAAWIEKETIEGLVRNKPNDKILLMGDFNDNPDDSSIAYILDAGDKTNEVKTSDLYNPFKVFYSFGNGTEFYDHKWNLFDQIILSGNFLKDTCKGLHFENAEIYKPDFLIDHSKGHEGEPHRSFIGAHWINGFSDHFPVIVYLSLSNPH